MSLFPRDMRTSKAKAALSLPANACLLDITWCTRLMQGTNKCGFDYSPLIPLPAPQPKVHHTHEDAHMGCLLKFRQMDIHP